MPEKDPKERRSQVVIYVPGSVLDAVSSAADVAGVSRSQWIVAAMERQLAAEDADVSAYLTTHTPRVPKEVAE